MLDAMQAIQGTVIHGKGLGHQIGFPTANIFYDNSSLPGGTWRRNVAYEDAIYKALGPYFPEQQLLEAHLLGFDGDLYEQELTIYPLYRIRNNQQFEHFEDLVEQITKDKMEVINHPVTVMTFGTFDFFHPGHAAYLEQAKKRGDQLVTIIARDSTVQQLKAKTPSHDEHTRKDMVAKSGYVDIAELGDTKNHYQCLLDYQPGVICLGYDQHSFEEGISDFYAEQGWSNPTIVRLAPFQPDKYKSSYLTKTSL